MLVNALWMVEPEKLEIRQVEVCDPGWGQLQIEIKACGICAWDQYLFKGKNLVTQFPFTFGHEPAGIVIKTGPGAEGFKPGDAVICCGGGDSMAQVVNIPCNCAAVISSKVTDWAQWVAEPIACVINSICQTPIIPAMDIVLIGAGYMGMLKLQALKRTLAGTIRVFEPNPAHRKLAREEFGAEFIYDPYSNEGKAALCEIENAGGADLIIECSSTTDGFGMANRMLKDSGALELFAWHRGERTFDGTPWHLKGIHIYNTAPDSERFYLPQRVRQAEKLISMGIFNQKKLITHVDDYRNAQTALERALYKTDGYIKGVITF